MDGIIKFTIPVAPVTKKNSSRIIWVAGHPKLIPSKAYCKYAKDVKKHIPRFDINEPVNIKATFFMKTKRHVDLVNLQEALLDVMVQYGCIADDNSKIVVSMDFSRVDYDSKNPRTEVEITGAV